MVTPARPSSRRSSSPTERVLPAIRGQRERRDVRLELQKLRHTRLEILVVQVLDEQIDIDDRVVARHVDPETPRPSVRALANERGARVVVVVIVEVSASECVCRASEAKDSRKRIE